VVLPECNTPLPREKPVPKPKAPTRWEAFAERKVRELFCAAQLPIHTDRREAYCTDEPTIISVFIDLNPECRHMLFGACTPPLPPQAQQTPQCRWPADLSLGSVVTVIKPGHCQEEALAHGAG
jgi:hypothetical protein